MEILPQEVESLSRAAAKSLSENLGLEGKPLLVSVLGSGWEKLPSACEIKSEIPFSEIVGFAEPKVEGHEGKIVLAEAGETDILFQLGRLHCYEGYSPLTACFPIWAYAALGVKAILLLCAAGGLNPVFLPGDLIIVSDHILLWGENPLTGLPYSSNPRFHLEGSNVYSPFMSDALRQCLPPETRVDVGVYAYTKGPSYETPAEATLLRVAGADVVGMSIAQEALTAHYLGMEVAAMCCVTNSLLPPPSAPLTHDLVLEVAGKTVERLTSFPERYARMMCDRLR